MKPLEMILVYTAENGLINGVFDRGHKLILGVAASHCVRALIFSTVMGNDAAGSNSESAHQEDVVEESGVIADAQAWIGDHGDYLYRYALIRVRDVSTAEDLVQETLLAAIQSASNGDSGSKGRPWLTGILRHKVYDHFRRLTRERAIFDDEAQSAELEDRFDDVGVWKHEPALGPAEWGSDAVSLLQTEEFMAALKQCLAKLPPRCGDAFVLREMDGVDSSRIQEILNISASNFWVLLHRARMQLRLCLEHNWLGIRS